MEKINYNLLSIKLALLNKQQYTIRLWLVVYFRKKINIILEAIISYKINTGYCKINTHF